jgi:hypothetical protein
MGGPTKRKGEPAGFRSREGCQPVWESRCLVVMKAMGNNLAQLELDYWVYRLARLLLPAALDSGVSDWDPLG